MTTASTRALIQLSLRVDPDATALRLVRGLVRSLLGDHGFRSDQVEGVLLGLDEVLTNACFHGGARERGESVELALALFADRLEIEVSDRGTFVAPEECDAELPDDDAESGRGLFLIRRTMDTVSYEAREGGGTRVRLVKRR